MWHNENDSNVYAGGVPAAKIKPCTCTILKKESLHTLGGIHLYGKVSWIRATAYFILMD